jgi:hypothetical protein
MERDKSRSHRALDARHWNPDQIGALPACQALSGIAVQGGSGNVVDGSPHKKLMTIIAAPAVAVSALGTAMFSSFKPGRARNA